ncbi:MAG: hypothetical protein QGG46_03415 [Gammaproteobacteria bacterium]|nr:hypothetical protein [Gammaproteobacteria bacterium]
MTRVTKGVLWWRLVANHLPMNTEVGKAVLYRHKFRRLVFEYWLREPSNPGVT